MNDKEIVVLHAIYQQLLNETTRLQDFTADGIPEELLKSMKDSKLTKSYIILRQEITCVLLNTLLKKTASNAFKDDHNRTPWQQLNPAKELKERSPLIYNNIIETINHNTQHKISNIGNEQYRVYCSDKHKSDNLLFAFHGTPNTDEISRFEVCAAVNSKHEYSVFVPYTTDWTSTKDINGLVKSMNGFYQVMKERMMSAKQIDLAGHSYGPMKMMAFLTAVAMDQRDGATILKKVKNLHLYAGAMTLKSEQLGFFKALFFWLRRILCGQWGDSPSIKKFLHKLVELQPEVFKNHKVNAHISHNLNDKLVRHTEDYMHQTKNQFANSISSPSYTSLKFENTNSLDIFRQNIGDTVYYHNPQHGMITPTFLANLPKETNLCDQEKQKTGEKLTKNNKQQSLTK